VPGWRKPPQKADNGRHKTDTKSMDQRLGAETVSFGAWVRRRRRALDLTQAKLGALAACTESAIRKIEADERRPSRRIAERLADALKVSPAERAKFIDTARGEGRVERLEALDELPEAERPAPLAGNLPAAAPQLIGRERELELIGQRLEDPGCRLLTVLGPGGIGKTQLALAAAARAAPQFADGAWVVLLATAETSEALLSSLARAFGVVFAGEADPQTQLHGFLRRRQALVVLDNFEQLLGATQSVAALLAAAPQVKILLTTRERLNVGDEWLLPLDGLALAQDGALRASPAVQLFCERAARVRPGFPANEEELGDAAKLCALLEGLPLGIELAAAWVRALSCRDILREVERSADFLRSSARDAPARHASLRAVFDHSIGRLEPQERQAFARVSVFRSAFDLNAAQAVTGATLAQLVALADKSLLRPLGEGRFGMHELLRQLARELLAGDAQDEERIHVAHSRYFLQALASEGTAIAGSEAVAAVARVVPALPDIRAAWFRLLERREYDLLASAATCLFWVYELSSLINEGAEFCEKTLEQLAQDPQAGQASPGRYIAGMSEAFAGWSSLHKGRYEDLLRHALAAADWFRPLGKSPEASVVLGHAARAAAYTGRDAQARALIEEAIANDTDSPFWPGFVAAAQASIGMAHWALGEFEESEKRMRSLLHMQRAPGQPWFVGNAHYFLGEIAMRTGRLEETQHHWQEAADHWMRLSERHPNRVLALSHLGRVAAARGDAARARSHFEQALRESQNIGFAPYTAHALNHLGNLDAAEQHHEEALRRYLQSLQVCRDSGDRVGAIRSLIRIAQAQQSLHDRSQAYAALREAAQIALEVGQRKYAAEAIAAMAKLVGAASEAGVAGAPPSAESLREQLDSLPGSLESDRA
jgi:predicted ATPase/DNA-binding XRE family transcriptional regulator